jgi:RNAse (barnase) inhibitor barstar
VAVHEVTLNGAAIRSPGDFYSEFFTKASGIVPDYGGRNLDALVDDLRELGQPLRITWKESTSSRAALGEWFDAVLGALTDDGNHPLVEVDLR